MGSIRQQLKDHLEPLTVPYLFVGAGLSIRYANAESWPALLRRFAEPVGKPYEYYASTADGDLPQLASLLAEDFHELWWSDNQFQNSRDTYAELITARDSALKVEISSYLADTINRLPREGKLSQELSLLRDAVVDGIITTNFDPILEHIRPDLHCFVGQDELLFADPQGVGEIYKIHGSCSQPNSLVLTASDYDRFNSRNPYLVAKLLTIFVEHPIVFLGYSLNDRNVQRILVDIARCLTDERIEQLSDRLLFVQYSPDAAPAMTTTVVSAEGFVIPVQSLVVPDFVEVFSVLGETRRRLPARLLRHLRKEIYELVSTSEPTDRLYVEELDPSTDPSEVEVYAGIGAIARLTTSYVGLDRVDLLEDVLVDRNYDPTRVVLEALPGMGSKTTMLPVYKYLRSAGFLAGEGDLRDAESLPPRVVARVESRDALLAGLAQYRARAEKVVESATSFDDLVARCSPDEVLYFLPFINQTRISTDALRKFLCEHRAPFDEDRQPLASQWAKAVCLYDWLAFGRQFS